nr:tRNA glutamyl-Q synthetase [Cytophagales bacterium]
MDHKEQSLTKTRLAPTPSGYLHLGNALSFAITCALAQKHRAKVFLRIDDLDRARCRDLYIQDIFDTLDFLAIPYDDGPRDVHDFKKNFSQVHRMPLYENALTELAEKNACFACSCSRKTLADADLTKGYPGYCKKSYLPLNTTGCCWRFRSNLEKPVPITIYPNHQTAIGFPLTMADFILRKKDGYPAYQLTSVMDDLHYGVDLIIRGADLWDSSLAQLHLAERLSTGQPFLRASFHHHALVKIGETKLSKSSGSTSIRYLRKSGEKKEAIFRRLSDYLHFPIPAETLDEFALLYLNHASQQ